MAKGVLAKKVLINKIIGALSDEYVGTSDNKYYFAIPENGEKVQIAITLTCPKVGIDTSGNKINPKEEAGLDFSYTPPEVVAQTKREEKVEADAAEQENVKKLLSALGF